MGKGKGTFLQDYLPIRRGGYKTPEKWPSVQDAMVDMMARLERAVGPVIIKAVERS